MNTRAAKSVAARSPNTTNGSKRAVLYLRVSTKEQARKGGEAEGYSIPAQRAACHAKAESLGAIVVEEFVDAGESGRSMRRPALQQLLRYVRENEVDLMVVHKLDRLARSLNDHVKIMAELDETGVEPHSCSEQIDNSPGGKLMRTIMAGMAEFYSDNLATEILKGSEQKAQSGGTIGRAPIGYLNVRKIENDVEIRTVEIDPVRAPLVTWAFETYATGDWSLHDLVDELERKGLETIGTGKRAPGPLYLSHLHRVLIHPYYKGIVRYRGAEHPGKHPPLVTSETWQRVQEVLKAHYTAGERERKHEHYLKGSVYCGQCKSRLIITNARGRRGKIYPYFVCSGRHNRRTNCTFRAVLITAVEDKVTAYYASQQLAPEVRQALEGWLRQELKSLFTEATAERKLLRQRRQTLETERAKLLKAHLADAVPLDLLKTEQDRISTQLSYIEQRINDTEHHHTDVFANLARSFDLAADLQAAYEDAPPRQRRQFNQAIFTRLYIEDDGSVSGELAEPFHTILNTQLQQRAVRTGAHTPEPALASARAAAPEPDWDAWEATFNDSQPATLPRQALAAQGPPGGLNKQHLVEAAGIEPASAAAPPERLRA